MTMLLYSFGRAAVDYRLAYTILVVHSVAMASLVWYLDVDPHYQTASLYVNWSFSAVSSMASLYMMWTVLMMLARREEHPTAALKTHMEKILLRNDRLAHAAHSTGIFVAMIFVFSTVKSTIPVIAPFSWDQTLFRLDRALFGGVDPYVVTSKVFGNAYGLVALNFVYNLWMVIFTVSMVVVPWIGNHELRLRYIFTTLLTWFVGGNVVALLLSSSGPCFVELLYGDDTYAPLMTLLKDVNAVTGMVWALIAQDILWESYTRDVGGISGISAMPSLHVAVAVIIACVAWQRGGLCRGIGLVYAVTIYIGSIQLGWHYATDGIMGGGIALLFWNASAYLTDWSLSRRLEPTEAV
ncbi:phosphatase PAP2 family protein [Ensifer sp. SSB1]|uniref:phosphatase PAP2 family protein n=1 Tax=Ensifer sp. SSB1 TaxID=2795385 RepID=UPI001A5A98B2|nr:phosphatase PAP2 family protein [Ensifer sp. SSB1]MBK5569388.1 phosphatase PAP2 family protein [Ensifer sp. SSB1]